MDRSSSSRMAERPRQLRHRRSARLRGAAVVVVTLLATIGAVSLAGAPPASADIVVGGGCTIVSNPTPTNFTNCPGADLSFAFLSGVDLSYANLAGARFTECSVGFFPPDIFQILCFAAQLAGANLHDANLSGALFPDCLVESPFGFPIDGNGGAANLSDANLSGADLSSALFSCSFFFGSASADFGNANLTGANLTGTSLIPADKSVSAPSSAGAVVSWPTPDSVPGATSGACTPPSGSTFPPGTTTVTCQVLDDFGDVATGTFAVTVKQPTTTTLSASANPAVVGQQVTYTATVSPAPTGGTVAFQGVPGCAAVPMSGSTATCTATASVTGAHNVRVTFSGNDTLESSTDVRTEVVTQQPCEALAGCDLSGLDLSGANLTGANLTGANLTGADLSSAELSGADLTGADLTDANLAGTNLTNAKLDGANVTGTLLVPTNQTVTQTGTGTVVSWPTPQPVQGATPGSCTPASGSTFLLGHTTVTCQVLDDLGGIATGTFTVNVKQATTTTLSSSINPVVVGGHVTYTATVSPAPGGGFVAFTDTSNGRLFTGCEAVPVSGSTATCTASPASTGGENIVATFSGTDAFAGSHALFTEVVTQEPCKTLSGCNLSGLPLFQAKLSGANLKGANLTGANLSRADLSDANLTGANLTDAGLFEANLSGANLAGLDLHGDDLRGANLSGANLSGAVLNGAELGGANLTGANLSGAALNGATLIDANLTGGNLTGAALNGASLSGNLTGANLSGANLSQADLFHADLTGANLTGAVLNGASLIFANLKGANLNNVKLNNVDWVGTICPDGTNSNNNGATCIGHLQPR